MNRVSLVLFLLICFCSGARGLHDQVRVRYASTPPVIDGVVEQKWLTDSVPYNMGDVKGETNNLIVENYLTMTRLLWDKKNLYVSFICSDNTIVADMTEHDQPLYRQEMCEVMLRMPDNRIFELSVNPKNVVYDAMVIWDARNKMDVNVGFTAQGVRSAVGIQKLDDEKSVWTVEIAIPWTCIAGFTPEKGKVLSGNFLRYEHVVPEKLKEANAGSAFLPLSVFPTGINGWPAGPSSLRPVVLE